MTWDHEFIDKKGRKITFDVAYGSVRAYSEGKGIGELTLKIEEFDERFAPTVLADVVDVDAQFRNAGIGSEMVRLAFNQHGPIVPPSRYEGEPAKRNSIAYDGMRLLLSCQKKGWVAEFPDMEKPEELDE